MFKKILIYVLVICSVSNGAMQLVVYSGYKMNKEYKNKNRKPRKN
jgi:hypothetical protein